MTVEHRNFIYDAWLAEIIGVDTYRLIVDDEFINRVGDENSEEYRLLRDVQSGPVFLFTRVPTHHLSAVRFLEEKGFNLIDASITLQKPISKVKPVSQFEIRNTVPDDEEDVVRLAGKSFRFSRFHQDSQIPGDIADRTRSEWVRGYFRGTRGNDMVIALDGEKVTGFLLLVHNDSVLTIDFIAVDKGYRGRGIAGDMIKYAEAGGGRFSVISTGTQITNLPSLRLYEGMGFRIAASQYTFHYHH